MIQTCCWCLIDGFDETRSFEFPLPQALTTQALTLSQSTAGAAERDSLSRTFRTRPFPSPPLFPFFPIWEGNWKEQSKGRTNGPLFHVIAQPL